MLTRRAFVSLAAAAAALPAAAQDRPRNIILVTSDGVRWQDFFGGMDPMLKNEKSAGMDEAAGLRARFWRDTPEERRRALMPFFWGTLAPRGVVLGDPAAGGSMHVTNRYRVSYPGYSEILTGRAQDEAIRGNDKVQNPTETVLEFLRRKMGLQPAQAAVFGSWGMFHSIAERSAGSLFISAGYDALPAMPELNEAQFNALTPWDEARHDYITFRMAMRYLKMERPRVLYIALDETDDWAHDHRYDRVLESLHHIDEWLQQLWEYVESAPDYRGSTLLALATDHGRGGTLADWNSHGTRVAGAERIWAAFFGPGVPARGEIGLTAAQRDIAPTILQLAGYDYREYAGVLGKPIELGE